MQRHRQAEDARVEELEADDADEAAAVPVIHIVPGGTRTRSSDGSTS
jgi:hypothetical protein